MATEQVRDVALMSIHPRYAEAILEGTKRVEFRKSAFRREVSHLVIYATAPICMVIGTVEVNGVEERPPEELWAEFQEVGGIEEADFFSYYGGRERGVAYRLGEARRLAAPLALQAVRPNTIPPQSYVYLDPSSLASMS